MSAFSSHCMLDMRGKVCKMGGTMKTNPFDAFQAVPSPANAVRLAVSDHKQASLIDWPFVDALNKAADQLNQHAQLVNMLTRLTEKTERANAIQHSGGKVDAEDWAELHQLANEARGILATL